MKLWRLDATHDELDGSFSRFHVTEFAAAMAAGYLTPQQWLVDWYEVEVTAPATIVTKLTNLPWPIASVEALVQLAARPHIVVDECDFLDEEIGLLPGAPADARAIAGGIDA